jgi:hypothetical protein
MCQEKKCNWFRHLLGLCEHRRQVRDIKESIHQTRDYTSQDIAEFNRTLNLLIKDESIKVTLKRISKLAKKK